MGLFRRLALRLLLKVAGRAVWVDAEQVLMAGPCSRCGAWRCPDCHWLIRHVNDHNWACVRRSLPHPGST